MNNASFPVIKSRTRLLGQLGFASLACVPLLLGGCSVFRPIPEPKGSLIEKEDYSQLIPGTSTRSDVIDLLGSPTTHATFDDNTWIYISMVTSPTPLGFPSVDKQQVVVLNFNNSGVLTKMNTLNRKDAMPVRMISAKTPTPGTKTSIMQQLLGNVGRYNPMSNMNSAFGGSAGPIGSQGTGNGGAGNSLP
ncbi:outer membrane protein assembly factor BamE [Swingsia samuiensis]|uniref:Outer membrane protein assembly factor BamE n=1 Tax=Swingsia samuiensis TaxID=1293412 RepID=A0A4Y6UJQ9_9PROT|nr:outer membrane protein assembly factor BamE [Swingsia samuiensis]QDH16235.1 outer membrane protein assembly factor BamE [Swingsia samuiensis]